MSKIKNRQSPPHILGIPERRLGLLEKRLEMLKGCKEEVTWVCTSTSPEARAGVPVQRLGSQRWKVSLSQSPLLWWRCPLQAFFLLWQSNSFMKPSEVISKSSKLCSQGDFIRRIYSVTQLLTRHPGISFKLPLRPPRKNLHAASQTLKIRRESPCHSDPNQLSWLAPAGPPASWWTHPPSCLR